MKHENLYITLDGVQLFVLHYTNKKTGCLLYLACGHLWYFPIMASSHKLNINDFITNIDLNFVERIKLKSNLLPVNQVTSQQLSFSGFQQIVKLMLQCTAASSRKGKTDV